jgi:hypothetical protein
VIFFSCKKEKQEILITGEVKDPNLVIPLPDVQVDLFVQKIENGIMNHNFVFESSVSTDSEGKFSFTLAASYAEAFKLVFTKDQYFSLSDEMEVSDFTNNQHSGTYNLYPSAFIRLHVKNIYPYDSNDQISFHIKNGTAVCSDCCTTDYTILTGTSVDYTNTCRITGHSDITIEWFVQKAGNATPFMQSYFCEAFVTTDVEILY